MDEDRVPLDGGPAGGPADGPADFTADGGGPLAGWMQPKPAEPQRPADMALKSSATAWPQQPAAAAAALSMAAPGLDTPSMPPMARASNPQSASPAVLQPAAVGQQQQQQQQMALATEPADKQSSPAGRGGAGGQQRRTCFCGCQKPYAESSGVPADALAAAPDARADASPSAAALVQLTEPAGGSAFSSVGPAAALQVQQSQLQGQGRPAPPAAPDGQLSAVPSAWEALSPSPSRFPLGGHDTRRPSSPDSAARDPPQQSRRQRQQQPQAQLLQASLLQPDMASSNNSSSGNTSNNSYSNSNSNRNDNRTTNNTDNSASTTQSVPLQDPRRPVPPPLPTTLDHQPHSSRDAMGILHIHVPDDPAREPALQPPSQLAPSLHSPHALAPMAASVHSQTMDVEAPEASGTQNSTAPLMSVAEGLDTARAATTTDATTTDAATTDATTTDAAATTTTTTTTAAEAAEADKSVPRYDVRIIQQPIRARMCGFGDKDRRPVDPPPVLQLVCHMPDGSVVDQVHAELPFLVCYCSLWTADETVECQFLVANRADRTMTPAAAAAAADGMIDYRCLHQTLIGTTIAPSMNLVNLAGVEGVFFIFFDLSIRTEGIYKLKFILCDMSAGFEPGVPPMLSQKARVIAQVFSDSFRVYTPSQFAGMMESTELTKSFARQGIKLPIRNTTSRNRRQWLRKAAPYTFTTTAGPGASASLPASTLAVPHIISTAHLPPLPPSTGSAGSTGSASSAGPASAPGIPSAPYPPAALHHRHSHPNIHAHHSQHASSQPHGWSLPPSRGSHGPPSQPGGVHPYNGTSHGDGGDDDDRSTETTITDAGGGGASRRLSWTGS